MFLVWSWYSSVKIAEYQHDAFPLPWDEAMSVVHVFFDGIAAKSTKSLSATHCITDAMIYRAMNYFLYMKKATAKLRRDFILSLLCAVGLRGRD